MAQLTPPMLSQHKRSQALVKEEGCDRCGEPTLNLAILIEMKPERIRKVASEVCGVTKGSGGEAKDTWWWNEEVQRAIKEKKDAIDACTKTGVWTT